MCFSDKSCFNSKSYARISQNKLKNNFPQGKQFFSKHQVPGSAGMDLFKQTLDPEESHFSFPPPYLCVDALRHLQNQQVPQRHYLENL